MDVLVFVGLQGAGKSTFFQTYCADHVYLSKDMLKASKTMNKAARQALFLEEALKDGRSVVIDNCDLS